MRQELRAVITDCAVRWLSTVYDNHKSFNHRRNLIQLVLVEGVGAIIFLVTQTRRNYVNCWAVKCYTTYTKNLKNILGGLALQTFPPNLPVHKVLSIECFISCKNVWGINEHRTNAINLDVVETLETMTHIWLLIFVGAIYSNF